MKKRTMPFGLALLLAACSPPDHGREVHEGADVTIVRYHKEPGTPYSVKRTVPVRTYTVQAGDGLLKLLLAELDGQTSRPERHHNGLGNLTRTMTDDDLHNFNLDAGYDGGKKVRFEFDMYQVMGLVNKREFNRYTSLVEGEVLLVPDFGDNGIKGLPGRAVGTLELFGKTYEGAKEPLAKWVAYGGRKLDLLKQDRK